MDDDVLGDMSGQQDCFPVEVDPVAPATGTSAVAEILNLDPGRLYPHTSGVLFYPATEPVAGASTVPANEIFLGGVQDVLSQLEAPGDELQRGILNIARHPLQPVAAPRQRNPSPLTYSLRGRLVPARHLNDVGDVDLALACLGELLALLEDIRAAFQEKHTEYVLLELRGVQCAYAGYRPP